MKIFLIVLATLLSSGLACFLWHKRAKSALEAEIDRIKIPDDTFDEPQQKP